MTNIDLKDADTNPHGKQVGTSVLDPRVRDPLFPILLPAIRPVVCSMGLYEDPEASTNPTQIVRDTSRRRQRRLQDIIHQV